MLTVDSVCKEFPGTRALDEVSMNVGPGEILALAGGNGSGKSTLIKVLAGVYAADSGSLSANGSKFDLRHFTPQQSRMCGMHFVHQERTTFPTLSVAENLAFGRGFETRSGFHIDRRSTRRRTAEILERFRIDVQPEAELGSLRQSDQTMVAIARALQDQEHAGSGVLVLDEATASLPKAEVEIVLNALRTYAADGQAIVFVTHRLDEILLVADRIKVLRDGRSVIDDLEPEAGHERLVELIAGRAVEAFVPVDQSRTERLPAVELREVCGGAARSVSMTVRAGEIYGLVGIAGSGCSSVLRMLFGAQRCESGEVLLAGKTVRIRDPRDAIAKGIVLVPPDRLELALFPEEAVFENMTIASLSRYWRKGWLRVKEERKASAADARRFNVVAASNRMPVSQLSGGNQQKVVLARWLRLDPRLLLLDEPTQGVDIGARAELWSLVRRSVEGGSAAIVASSDIEELAGVCNRVGIVREGRLVAELAEQAIDAERIVELQHARQEVS